MIPPTWGVVATVREPANLLAAFAAHYLSLGASRVYLYLDAPDPTVRTRLAELPQCVLRDTGPTYFREAFNVARPVGVMRRQRLNANHAYRLGEVEWLLHVDADEFLASPDFASELAALPDVIDTLHIPNGERSYVGAVPDDTIFGGALRLRFRGPPRSVDAVLGKGMGRYTVGGFCGHVWGKSATRTGRGLRLGLHTPKREPRSTAWSAAQALICHFDGLTPLHWMSKLARYVGTGIYDGTDPAGRHRAEQIAHITRADTPRAALTDLHNRLRLITPKDAERLTTLGVLRAMPVDPAAAVARLLPGSGCDLTPAAFDADLSTLAPDLMARLVDPPQTPRLRA